MDILININRIYSIK